MARRRLKKPIRIALYKTLRFTKALTVSSIAGFTVANVLVPSTVMAEVNPVETAKTIATLKSGRSNDAKALKESLIETYAAKLDEDIDADNLTVVMTYPACVTAPTVENSKFEVVEKKTETISESSNDTTGSKTDTEVTSNVSNTNTTDSTSSNKTPSESEESSSSEETAKSDSTLVDENIDSTDLSINATKSNQDEAQTSVSVSSSDTDSVKESDSEKEDSNNTQKDSAVEEKSSNQTNSDPTIIENSVDLDEIDTIEDAVVVSTTDDTVKNVVDTSVVTTQLQPLNSKETDIKLTEQEVTLSLYTVFAPSDYIKTLKAKDIPFPAFKVDGNVDTSTVGTYELKYTVIDSAGNSDSETLTVHVIKDNDQLEAERKEKVKEATNAFIELTNGQAWDMDGYYGDQCWDLWAKYVISEGLNFDYGCAPDGFADYVYKKYDWSGADKYFAKISKSNIQAGDWLFWDKGSSCPLSHVALLVKDNGDGTGLCLTQSKGQGTRLQNIELDVLGGFRRIA